MIIKHKFKIGDRVKVVNGWARSTHADVKNGDIGTVTGYWMDSSCAVALDNDIYKAIPWSIPQRGLELIKEEL